MLSRIAKCTKKRFYAILKRKTHFEGNEEITITNVVTSVTKDVTNAELNFAAGEIHQSSIRIKFKKMLREKLESIRQ